MTSLEKIQKAALARLEAGEDIEHILQDYADYEDELRPVLEEASGTSLSSLIHSPKPKAKLKAKNETSSPAPILVPILLLIVAALGVAIYFLLQPSPGITTITVEPIPPTEAPIVVSVTHEMINTTQLDNAYCDSIGQLSLNTYPVQQGQQEYNNGMIEVTATSLGLLAMPTPMPTPEMLVAPESAPMEASVSTSTSGTSGEMAPPVDLSGSSASEGGSGSTSGSMGGMGADGSSVELGRSAETTTSDIAVVGGDTTIVATSVATYDEREADTDDYADGAEAEEAAAYSVESTGMAAPIVANQAMLMPLNAGEIDDNADWDTYQEYRRNFLSQPYLNYGVRDLDTTDRQIISVVDENGLPVLGACVQIFYGESFITASRTYATGLTLFFPNLNDRTRYLESFRLVVSKENATAEATLDRSAIGGLTTVTLPMSQQQASVQLDVMFLLDATGSMSDEIAQLQTNILEISAQLDAMPNEVDVRFGLVSYRDRGDEYVTRVYDFTSDVQLFQANLMNVVAGGGGDYPEALNEGFHMALNGVNWRGEEAIKLVFLVADAPPHVDYPNDADYSILMQDSLARGIKVHPIASSGLQPEGEYVLRQIGQFTMGHFLFLTYEGGVVGTAGEDRPDLEVGEARDEQGIGDYSVAQLDELVLRLITDEIAALQGE